MRIIRNSSQIKDYSSFIKEISNKTGLPSKKVGYIFEIIYNKFSEFAPPDQLYAHLNESDAKIDFSYLRKTGLFVHANRKRQPNLRLTKRSYIIKNLSESYPYIEEIAKNMNGNALSESEIRKLISEKRNGATEADIQNLLEKGYLVKTDNDLTGEKVTMNRDLINSYEKAHLNMQ